MSQLPEEPLYGNEDWQQALDDEQRRAEDEEKREAAWAAHIAYCSGLNPYGSARGYGPGKDYEYHGPETMGADGEYHREQRLK